MPPPIATLVYLAGIATLFFWVRDPEARVSRALWIPTIWLMIVASRPVSVWLQVGPTYDSRDAYIDGSPLDAAVFAAILVAGLIVLALRAKRVLAILRRNGPILLFFAFCLISVAWSDYPFVAFKRWIKAVGDLAMVLVILTEKDSLAATKRVLTRAGFVLIPISLLFINYYPALGRSYNQWTWTPMFSGVTMGKNLLGMTCLICGIGSWWCFLTAYRSPKSKQRSRRMMAYAVITAMATYLILKADSMTSFSCLVLAGSVLFISSLESSSRNKRRLHLSVAVAVLIAAFALFMDTGGFLVKTLGRDTTLTGRTAVWGAVLAQVRHPLVGAGFESFWMGNRLLKIWDAINQPGIQEAHNGYLEVYLNLGWMGVLLLAVLMVSGYRNVFSALSQDRLMGRVMLAFFVVGAVYNFTEAGFRMMAPAWIFFLFAITSAPEREMATSKVAAVKMPPRLARPAIREPLHERTL